MTAKIGIISGNAKGFAVFLCIIQHIFLILPPITRLSNILSNKKAKK
jgi:hypothetical protein